METDRLLRDFVAIEEEKHRERELENIDVTTYSAAKGETPATILPTLIRKYPNVYVVRDFVDTESAKLLLNEINDDRLVITNVQAKDAPEALLRMLQKQVPQREFAKDVVGRDVRAADSQAVRELQGGLSADARSGEEAGPAGGQRSRRFIARRNRRKSRSRARLAAASDFSAARRSSSCWWSTIRFARF